MMAELTVKDLGDALIPTIQDIVKEHVAKALESEHARIAGILRQRASDLRNAEGHIAVVQISNRTAAGFELMADWIEKGAKA